MSPSTDLRSEAVVAWYRENARDLPWRREVSAYRTLVSEIMLQQTRVEAVKPYFERFLTAFPTVEALAESDEQELMKLWQGLGYYSRARNLRRCAKAIVSEHGGVIPRTVEELRRLPGIGDYTAGAIAAFAYGEDAVAVDGNVLRVVSRLVGERGDILLPDTRRRIGQTVRAMLPSGSASDFGQGLIELGATVCLPNAAPRCDACPLADACFARREGCTDEIPYRRPRAARRIEERTVLLVRSGELLLIRRRPARGLLAGLWEPPSLDGTPSDAEILAEVRSLGLEPLRIERLHCAKHIFTHVEWHMQGCLVEIADPEQALPPPYRLATPEDLKQLYSIPSAFAAYVTG